MGGNKRWKEKGELRHDGTGSSGFYRALDVMHEHADAIFASAREPQVTVGIVTTQDRRLVKVRTVAGNGRLRCSTSTTPCHWVGR
ncbi:MAG: hypothetical protein ACJAZO_002829 [Myxococcota bacterium]